MLSQMPAPLPCPDHLIIDRDTGLAEEGRYKTHRYAECAQQLASLGRHRPLGRVVTDSLAMADGPILGK